MERDVTSSDDLIRREDALSVQVMRYYTWNDGTLRPLPEDYTEKIKAIPAMDASVRIAAPETEVAEARQNEAVALQHKEQERPSDVWRECALRNCWSEHLQIPRQSRRTSPASNAKLVVSFSSNGAMAIAVSSTWPFL